MNISWEDPPYGDGEAYEKLCDESVPSDFYFFAKRDNEFFVAEPGDIPDDFVMVFIVPKLYFHKEGNMWDQSMFLNHILPDDLAECMEGIWENDADRSVEEIRQDMLKRGFEENKEFTKLINDGEIF